MFAHPNKKDEQKKKPTLQKPNKKPSLPNQRLRTSIQQPSLTINKIASIRTLPPFAYINSDSGTNSQNKSLECSDTHSQIWKQQYQLFEADHKDTIKDLDKQLQDVLETIKKERNLIDMKIWKLKSKFQQNYDRAARKSISKGNSLTIKQDASTFTCEDQYLSQPQQFYKKQQQSQFPEPVSFSSYFRELSNSLGLSSYEQNIQSQQIIEDQIKIRENKIILQILFQKVSKI